MSTTVSTTDNSQDLVGTTNDRGVYRAGENSKYTPEERDQLRALAGLDEASDADLDMLKMVANRTGLDPFAKEIYLIGRKTKTGGYRGEPVRWETKWTVQAGIDGFRKVTRRWADARNESVSIQPATFFKEDGTETPIWLKKWGFPVAASVTIRIGDAETTHVVMWDEYAQTKKDGGYTQMWNDKPTTMLGKCAEAGAHRKICSLTAGMYVEEEMQTVQATAQRMDQNNAESAAQVRAQLMNKKPEQEQITQQPAQEANNAELIEQLKNMITSATTMEQLHQVPRPENLTPQEDAILEELWNTRATEITN